MSQLPTSGDGPQIVFTTHAIERMAQRGITTVEVAAVIRTGTVVSRETHAVPHPKRVLLGWSSARPLHVVVADNQNENVTIVITVYEPNPQHWLPGFTRQR